MYGYSKLEWLSAKVPGQVHLDLMANGVIADPFENLHELGTRWVDAEDWVYKTEFDYVPDPTLPRVLLAFAGLDTVAAIYVNGVKLAEHDNMFVGFELDVSAALRPGSNELRVVFSSAERVGAERRARYFASEALPENLVHFDARAFVRKAQYMFGWDWGPRLISAGVWGKVELVQYRGRIRSVHVKQRHLDDGKVELSFHSECDGAGDVVHQIAGVPGVFRDGEVLRLDTPELWWPRGFGEQRLYEVTSLLVPNASASGDALERDAFDRRTTRIGLRRIALRREADTFGESFEFECNGKRVWCVGANWIPDSTFPAVVDRARVRGQVERAVGLNMNMLRIWGGGIYESEDFYDACDELGVLVWQDFPYACSFYPDGPQAQAVARAEATAAVKRLRNRASLAIYCGNNENLTMYQDKWTDASRHPPRYYGEHLYDRVLPEVVREFDGERPYIPSSPCGGPRANSDGFGDQHYWDVWHGRGDWKFYEDSKTRFASEFGFASAPGRKALAQCAAQSPTPLALPLRDLRARWHDKTKKGYETFIQYVELHYPKSETLEDWLYYSQLNQRDALRHGIEHYRRSEFCKGSLIWQLNDCWPVQSWAVIDSAFELKAAAYELCRLHAPGMLSIERSEGVVRLWTVLDNASQSLSAEATLEARSLTDGKLLERWSAAVTLEPGARRVAVEANVKSFDPATTLIAASFAGTSSFRLLSEPKEACFSEPGLRVSIDAGQLVIASERPVVDLYFWDDSVELGLADNFITLPAAGTRRIALRSTPRSLRARSLAGKHAISLTETA
jgi:beta-mannosidase